MEPKNGNKKKWVTPELQIIIRNRPEEAVLSACKGRSGGGPVLRGGCGAEGGICAGMGES